jgi:hypothetical protein
MSAQTVPFPKPEELAKAKRRAELHQDLLYISGALLVTAGIGLAAGLKFALIAAGSFCLIFPLTGIATSFIRGIRAPRR